MRRGRFVLVLGSVLVFALWTTGTAASATPTSDAQTTCLARATTVTVTGTQTVRWPQDNVTVPTGAAVDARTATFAQAAGPTYGLVIKDGPGGRSNLCMVGGSISSAYPYATTPWSDWHHTRAAEVRTPNFESIKLTATNVGDGIAFTMPTATGWKVTGARLTQVHDDCVEDDEMLSGTIDDSYLECYTAVSARSWAPVSATGPNNTVTVKNTMIWVKQMPTSYSNSGHPYNGPAIGTLFKWSTTAPSEGLSPKIALDNVVIRVDEPPQWYGNVDLPPSYYDTATATTKRWPITCTNVTVLWTGSGAYPGYISPSCPVTLITGTTAVNTWVWDKAIYDSQHP